jgi:hypothetical protein
VMKEHHSGVPGGPGMVVDVETGRARGIRLSGYPDI